MAATILLLNNFYALVRTRIFGNSNNIGEAASNGALGDTIAKIQGIVRNTSGVALTTVNLGYTGSYSSSGMGNVCLGGYYASKILDAGHGIFYSAGSNNDASTLDMYQLKSEIPSANGLSCVLSAATNDAGIVHYVTLRNTGESPLSIGEIGAYFGVRTSSGGSYNDVLFARITFDQVFTLGANESKIVNISYSMPTPTA